MKIIHFSNKNASKSAKFMNFIIKHQIFVHMMSVIPRNLFGIMWQKNVKSAKKQLLSGMKQKKVVKLVTKQLLSGTKL